MRGTTGPPNRGSQPKGEKKATFGAHGATELVRTNALLQGAEYHSMIAISGVSEGTFIKEARRTTLLLPGWCRALDICAHVGFRTAKENGPTCPEIL